MMKSKGTPLTLWAVRGNQIKGRLPTVKIETTKSETGVVDTQGVLMSHFIPKRMNAKHLPFFNESNILPCVVATDEQEAKDLFDARLLDQVQQLKDQIELIEKMLAAPVEPASSPTAISDAEAAAEDDTNR